MSVEHAGFAGWRHEISGDELSARLMYWRQRLRGAPKALQVPADRPRQAMLVFRRAQATLALSVGLTETLRALSRREDVSLFEVLLAAFKTLLLRYTAQEDVVVGGVGADRVERDLDELVEPGMLILRTDLSGDPTFRELLRRLREVILGALENAVAAEQLVPELQLQPPGSPGHDSLFRVLFSLAHSRHPLNIPSLRLERWFSDVDLHLEVADQPENLTIRLDYNAELFDAATVDRLLLNWRTLLEEVVADPRRRLAELPLLAEGERRQALVERNETEQPYPRDKAVHELFEEQADRTPEAIAVELEGARLTYRDVNRRSNQLARYLRELGVGPEVLVGLCMERSLEMIVGVLGNSQAGGAYLPLDPAYPRERLRFMLEDSGVHALLTHRAAAASCPSLPARTVLVDSFWDAIARRQEENFDSTIGRTTWPTSSTPPAPRERPRGSRSSTGLSRITFGPWRPVSAFARGSACSSLPPSTSMRRRRRSSPRSREAQPWSCGLPR